VFVLKELNTLILDVLKFLLVEKILIIMEFLVFATQDIPSQMEPALLLQLLFLIAQIMPTLMVFHALAIPDSHEIKLMDALNAKLVQYGMDLNVLQQLNLVNVQMDLSSTLLPIYVNQKLPHAVNTPYGMELYASVQQMLIKLTDVVKYVHKELPLMEQNVLIIARLLIPSNVVQIKLKSVENVFVQLVSMISKDNALNALKILNGMVNIVLAK
jgi:hypothetical protein